jgi:hypothetical protein
MLGLVQLLILSEVVSCCAQHGFCDRLSLLRRLTSKYQWSEQQVRITFNRLVDRGLIRPSHSKVGYILGRPEEIDALLGRGRRLCLDILELLDSCSSNSGNKEEGSK